MVGNKIPWFWSWRRNLIEASPVNRERWDQKQDAYWKLIEDILDKNCVSETMAKEIIVWLGTQDMLVPERVGAGIPMAIASMVPVAMESPEIDEHCYRPIVTDPKESIVNEYHHAKQSIAKMLNVSPDDVTDQVANVCITLAAEKCHQDYPDDMVESLRWSDILSYIALACKEVVEYNISHNDSDRWYTFEDESFVLDPSKEKRWKC